MASVIESVEEPLRVRLMMDEPKDMSDNGLPVVTFIDRRGNRYSLQGKADREGCIDLLFPKEILLVPGVLDVSCYKGKPALMIPWTPGLSFMSKVVRLEDYDLSYFRDVEARHPGIGERPPCDVSFVVLAKNEEKYLSATLKAIKAQDGLADYEIIVIDSGSRDGTPNIALQERAYLIRIQPEEFGHGRTRNLGAYLARGTFVCYLNADAIPVNPQWYISLRRHLDNGHVVAACSRQVPRSTCDPLRKHELLSWPFPQAVREPQIMSMGQPAEFLSLSPVEKRQRIYFETVSCLVRRATMLEYPFANVPFGEDFEWAKRMMENGASLVYEPLSMVEHSHDLYRSLTVALRKAFDDHSFLCRTIGPQVNREFKELVRHFGVMIRVGWTVAWKEDLSLRDKVSWTIWLPFVSAARAIGLFLGSLPCATDARMSHLLSLVGALKRR
ncbi:glycosyltransferase family 2 protein [Candidatus Nitrospira bockiana]